MREGADLLVAEQPGDLGNQQIAIGEMAPGERSPQFVQDLRERGLLFLKLSRQAARADAELACHLGPVQQQYGFRLREAWTNYLQPGLFQRFTHRTQTVV